MRPAPTDRSIESLLEFGVVNLDKPPGPSSHQVAAWVRDLLGIDRAGHTGTLDPKVTGSLPMLLGQATRLREALSGSKQYIAVLELHASPPAKLEAVLSEFHGAIYQKPPRKSAVTRSLRTRTVHEVTLLEHTERQVLLRIGCDPGTYIRKLCHDIGLVLGTGAHMGDLRRISTGPFDDTDLTSMHQLIDAVAEYEDHNNDDQLREIVRPAERAIEHLPQVTIAPNAATQVAQGAPVYAPGVIDAEGDYRNNPAVACFTPDGTAICLGRMVGDPDGDSGTVVALERVLV